ncbi:MAG: WG repeat-containing protein [Bacteroidota bacterium]
MRVFSTTDGDTAIACQYNKAGNFSGGLAAVRKAGKALYIDTKGQNAFGITFITGRDFIDGYAIASDRYGTGVINNSGLWVIPPKFDRVTVLDPAEGIVVVARKNRYGLMSLSGEKLTPLKYEALRKPCDGLMAARSHNSWGFISTMGNVEIPFRYYDVRNFSCNRAVVNERGHWGAIDRNNHRVIEFKYGAVSSFSEGICFAGVERGLNIMIDTDGVIISEKNRFRMLKDFSEGKSVIVDDYHDSGFIGRDGKLLFGRRFSGACSFSGSTAVVKEGSEWGIIDDNGAWIVPPSYDSIHDFVEGRAVVGVLKHEGLADSRGNICIQPEFQSVEMAPYGIIRVRQNGAMGYVDLAGREIWKPTK